MKRQSIAVRVGIFLTIIVVFFVVGQLWLLGWKVAREGYIFEMLFNDVSGLKLGDPVRVFGIKKGKVVNLEIQKEGVLVTGWIEKDIILKKDAVASIQDVAMISGTKTIVINPGVSGEPFDLSKPLLGQPHLGLSTVEIGTIAMQAEGLIKILKNALGEGGTTLQSLQSSFNNLNIILKENRTALKEVIDKGVGDLEQAKVTMEDLSGAITELETTIQQINSQKGTVGKMIYDEGLYDNLVRVSANLDSLLVDIRKNPGKYVQISVF